MLRIAGIWWIALTAIHALVGITLYFDQWQAIAQDGWFNAIAPDPLAPMIDREDALWFMFLTPFLLLLGRFCLWADHQHLAFPRSVGVILIVSVLIGLFLEPISGLWLLLPPSAMLLWSAQPKELSH
jgi:Family of unknown function (DUF6463)